MERERRLSPAEGRAHELGLQVRMRLAPDVVIAINRRGQAYQVTVPISRPVKHYPLTPKCADLCRPGYELHRPHLCCLMNLLGCGCRLPRVRDGKLPEAIPVTIYFLAINENRRFGALKRALLRKWLSIAEILSN